MYRKKEKGEKQIMKKVMNASKKYLITIISFAVILVACIGATIGITMAYFGDAKSNSANITLGASIKFAETGGVAVAAGSTTAVPSQTVNVTTTLKIQKGTGTVTKAVLQVIPTFEAGETGVTCAFTNGTTYDVTGVTGAKLIAQDNKLYLVDSTTTTSLKEIEPTESGLTISFTIPVQIPSTVGNTAGGKACSLSITAKALQSTIYTDGTNAVAKTVSAFGIYFDGLTA